MAGNALLDVIGDSLPTDHARQVNLADMLAAHLRSSGSTEMLDLGCGDGRAVDIVTRASADVCYTGIDIEDSPEVRSRSRADAEFRTFDGVSIPFGNGSFDLVYSSSVLEHVRHPEPLLREVTRVLRPGGIFLGSVSFLEPYHSYSIFNFTPYGLQTVLRDAGLEVRWLRPGIDGLTLTIRSLGFHRQFNRWFRKEFSASTNSLLCGKSFGVALLLKRMQLSYRWLVILYSKLASQIRPSRLGTLQQPLFGHHFRRSHCS